jgi:hypothetical protein
LFPSPQPAIEGERFGIVESDARKIRVPRVDQVVALAREYGRRNDKYNRLF